MGTRSDYYIGRGPNAEWLGSLAWDGMPASVKGYDGVLTATDEGAFRKAVSAMLAERKDATLPEQGWPWPWNDSRTTDWAYAFDAGVVYASDFGREWFVVAEILPNGHPPESYYDRPKTACFPDMEARKRVAYNERSGLMILVA